MLDFYVNRHNLICRRKERKKKKHKKPQNTPSSKHGPTRSVKVPSLITWILSPNISFGKPSDGEPGKNFLTSWAFTRAKALIVS